jgi:hypothetical protein
MSGLELPALIVGGISLASGIGAVGSFIITRVENFKLKKKLKAVEEQGVKTGSNICKLLKLIGIPVDDGTPKNGEPFNEHNPDEMREINIEDTPSEASTIEGVRYNKRTGELILPSSFYEKYGDQ